MQDKSIEEQLKARWERMNRPEALALAKGVRALSVPKVTIRSMRAFDRPVVTFEQVVYLPLPDDSDLGEAS
ncbi:hypothetical protein A1D17_04205 [Pseudomonas fluorescens]|uniref:Uncharacterized protein n=1 Tax=Pseudomonas fluorescens TaxID=294 RepID=A0A166QRR4_PSEFL|nr:hypothetical protein A1D17_04205 [Pseudomonas fluorescens]